MGAAPNAAWPADAVIAASNPAQSETIVLRVRLNTVDKGDLFLERTPDGDFLVKLQDLKTMGLKDPPGKLVIVDGEPFISLRSMQGVSFDFEEKALTLNITVDPHLLPSQAFVQQGQRPRSRGFEPTDNSAFFNYALNAAGGDAAATEFGFAGEVGVRLGDYLLLSDGARTKTTDGRHKFVRLMSSITHDDRRELRRTVVGDFFTPSRDFSTGVNLGGVSVSKLYGLNPYFIQFPMKSVGGTVALPSDLEVYLDGQRIRTERLQPGEFQLNDILAYGGARNVQLLLRDSFGRVQQLSYSFYFSDQPLRKGLHEYSYNAGAIRRALGTESNRYGPAAFTMFHRYGFTDALTIGMRAEATRQLFNAGPLATIVLGNAGVTSLALAGSTIAGHQGASALASYTYQSSNWSMGASLRRDWREYASIGDPPAVTNRKLEGNVSASYHLPGRGAVSLSHSFLSIRDGVSASPATPDPPFSISALDRRRVSSFTYSAPLVSGRASFTATLSRVKDKAAGGRNEAFVGVIVYLDKDHAVAANYRGDKHNNAESVQLTKNQPIGEGLGYVLQGGRVSDGGKQSLQLRSSIQYNAPAAILRADLGRNQDQQGRNFNDHRVTVSGGAGFVGGTVGFGRPITESFGIVKVGQLPDVAVSVNGQPIGKTNTQGKVFVPTLTPYFDNDVTIAAESVPIDYSIGATRKIISPSLRSGAMIDFAVNKLQAFSGKLTYLEAGVFKPIEFHEISIDVSGGKQKFETGRGGEFYIENLKPGNYAASVKIEGKPCLFDLAIPDSSETFVELGEFQCQAGR